MYSNVYDPDLNVDYQKVYPNCAQPAYEHTAFILTCSLPPVKLRTLELRSQLAKKSCVVMDLEAGSTLSPESREKDSAPIALTSGRLKVIKKLQVFKMLGEPIFD